MSTLRVGHAFDVHPFADDPARVLILGGVRFHGESGLAGHSDADVIAHACTDAILSPVGLGDIGQLFPDTDPALAGADSIVLLTEAVRQVHAAGAAVVNIDVTVVAERPKIAPRKVEMQSRLSEIVDAPVTIKGKRAEGLGALGRAEGIAAWAVALVDLAGQGAAE
ncbi:MAG: 2-C-methyl-D-erythritol 2,4-cyclodiphosphate synthase [Actinomycetota bacterium]